MLTKQCPECNGNGYFEYEITHHVSHEMAMDAGDMSYEGQPIPETVKVNCENCGGTGIVEVADAK